MVMLIPFAWGGASGELSTSSVIAFSKLSLRSFHVPWRQSAPLAEVSAGASDAGGASAGGAASGASVAHPVRRATAATQARARRVVRGYRMLGVTSFCLLEPEGGIFSG